MEPLEVEKADALLSSASAGSEKEVPLKFQMRTLSASSDHRVDVNIEEGSVDK